VALKNEERVGKTIHTSREGVQHFAKRELNYLHKSLAQPNALRYIGEVRIFGEGPLAECDVAALLRLMWDAGDDAFGKTVRCPERAMRFRDADSRSVLS
jgi:hypothetical protein